ncbi:MAG: cytochrome P450 [Actinobacteria bacterium]|nr:MAG: cytochrome P450 [Actinomycetota bacterium]
MTASELATLDWFTDQSLIEDPFPFYEAVRRRGPIWREPMRGTFLVTGYDETAEIYRDPDRFSSCNAFAGPFPPLPEAPHGDDVSALIEQYRDQFIAHDMMITFDPPKHTDHRGLLMRLLTPKRLQENEAFMERLANQRIDGFVANGQCDFVAEYAQPFSMLVIADLLGIPEADHAALRARFVEAGAPGAPGKDIPSNPLWFLEDFFIPYIEDRRREPQDDVLTKLALGTFSDGSMPELIETVRVATFLFAGGQGTVARFLGNTVKFIAENPDVQQQLRDDRRRIPNFVEEMLRFNSPVKVNLRMARRTTTIGGVEIPAGSTVVMLLPAAARDPRRFECPAEFHEDRDNAREHIAFGRGAHNCPGAPLVRADSRVTLECMLDRMGHIRISEAEHGRPGARRYLYTNSWILRGLDSLHVQFEPIR